MRALRLLGVAVAAVATGYWSGAQSNAGAGSRTATEALVTFPNSSRREPERTGPLYNRDATAACINRRGKAAGGNALDPRFMRAKRLPYHPSLREAGITSPALHIGLGKVRIQGLANETVAAAFLRNAAEARAAERKLETYYLRGGNDPYASAAIGHRGNVIFLLNPLYWFEPAQSRRELAPVFACLTR